MLLRTSRNRPWTPPGTELEVEEKLNELTSPAHVEEVEPGPPHESVEVSTLLTGCMHVTYWLHAGTNRP